jgi:two-component system, response regulator PdtaR
MMRAVLRNYPTPYTKFVSQLLLGFAGSGTQSGNENQDEEETQPISISQSTDRAVQILVVEDEGIVALDIKMTLRRMGHHVIATVDSGNDAIRMVTIQQPDLILMDIRLKGDIDGIETTKSIQQKHNIPVIYLTGQLDEITVKRAQATNPAGYLAKPFTVSELAILIQDVLKR